MANVNSNHSNLSPGVIHATCNRRTKLKSVVFKPGKGISEKDDESMEIDESMFDEKDKEKVTFEEDGELIDMETNDGGAAAQEFKSDDEEEGEVSSDDEQDSDDEAEGQHSDRAEEISENEQSQDSMAETTECSEIEPEPESNHSTPQKKKKKQKKKVYNDRRSFIEMENKIDSLADSVKIMQEMLLQQTTQKKNEKQKTAKTTSNDEHEIDSDTTIYQNILDKVSVNNLKDIQVDNEISFKANRSRESTSSEDQIDTSDDLMDTDVHEKFIADCAAAAAGAKRGAKCSYSEDYNRTDRYSNEDRRNSLPPHKPNRREDRSREVEASKARMFVTPGNIPFDYPRECNEFESNQISLPVITQYSTVVDENYLIIGSHLDGVL